MISFSAISEKCERDKSRVLVHCMTGKNRYLIACEELLLAFTLSALLRFVDEYFFGTHFVRSAAIVAAFLMKSRGWRLAQSFQWVKDRRPQVQLTDG